MYVKAVPRKIHVCDMGKRGESAPTCQQGVPGGGVAGGGRSRTVRAGASARPQGPVRPSSIPRIPRKTPEGGNLPLRLCLDGAGGYSLVHICQNPSNYTCSVCALNTRQLRLRFTVWPDPATAGGSVTVTLSWNKPKRGEASGGCRLFLRPKKPPGSAFHLGQLRNLLSTQDWGASEESGGNQGRKAEVTRNEVVL